jgi:hypothetical protein
MDISARAHSYPQHGEYGYQGCIYLILDKLCCIDNVRTRLCCIYIHSKFLCCKILMYPILKISFMLNFLGTFSMGVIFSFQTKFTGNPILEPVFFH